MITTTDNKSIYYKTAALGFVLTLMAASSAVQVDDVTVYLTPPSDPIPPNVMFILDESGSMNTSEENCGWVYKWGRWRYECTYGDSRMQQLKDAMVTLLDDPTLCETLGQNGRRLAAEYDRRQLVDRFENVLRTAVARGIRR